MGVGLGEVYDLSIGLPPTDLALAANTGKRVSMKGVDSITVVLIKAAGTAAEDPVLTLKQHTLSVGGVTSNLATIATYWVKSEATLDGDEVWQTVTQAASATIIDPGAGGVSAESQQIVAFNVRPEELAAGNAYISLDIADVGIGVQFGAVLYIVHVRDKGAPGNYANPLQ